MLDVFEVSNALANHIRTNCPDDIAIIAYYGSYAQGTATERSDLDFFFIPATPEGFKVSLQFVLNEISFDFWPISWERAERMASFEDSFTTIIADCQLIYVRSEEDHTRFMKLHDQISMMQEPSKGLELIEKAESELRGAYVHLYKMTQAKDTENMTYYRTESFGVWTKVFQCLALLNRTYFTKGWGKNMEQILNFPLKPSSLECHLDVFMNTLVPADIRSACEQLTLDTLDLVLKQKETYSSSPSYPDRMKGFYEEAKGTLDKIITACESNNYHTAYFATIGIQELIARFLAYTVNGYWQTDLEPNMAYQHIYMQLGFPDLVAHLNPHDLSQLRIAVEQLSSSLESHLQHNGVIINRFEDMEQFKAFLNLATNI